MNHHMPTREPKESKDCHGWPKCTLGMAERLSIQVYWTLLPGPRPYRQYQVHVEYGMSTIRQQLGADKNTVRLPDKVEKNC